MPRTTAVLLGFLARLPRSSTSLGFYDLSDSDALAQFGKGLTKWLIHFVFLALAVVWLSRRGQRLLLADARLVLRRDRRQRRSTASCSSSTRGAASTSTRSFLSPLTGGASQINIYGAVNGANVYRPNALTGDPNHLGIMLIVPLLVLTPLYLRLERGHRLRGSWLMR